MGDDPMLARGPSFPAVLPDAFTVLFATSVLSKAARNYGYGLHMWGAEPELGYHGWHFLVLLCLVLPLSAAGLLGFRRVSAVTCVVLLFLLAVGMQVAVTEPGLLKYFFSNWRIADFPVHFVAGLILGTSAVANLIWIGIQAWRRRRVPEAVRSVAGSLVLLSLALPLLLVFSSLGYAMVVGMSPLERAVEAVLTFGPCTVVVACRTVAGRFRVQ